MAGGEADESFREFRLPLWITATRQARAKSDLGCLAIIGVIAIVTGGALLAFLKSAPIGIGAAGITAALLILYWRRGKRRSASGLPDSTVEISAGQVRCSDYDSEASDWNQLTPFRWVLDGETSENKPFKRSDGEHDVPEEYAGEFTIEAARLDDQDQDNEFGYYNRGAIQFDFPQMVIGRATRARADWLVAWLNQMQGKAKAGELDVAESVSLPIWLNVVAPNATKTPVVVPNGAVDRKSR